MRSGAHHLLVGRGGSVRLARRVIGLLPIAILVVETMAGPAQAAQRF